MPDAETMRRAKRDKAQGKAPSTQAGEFVRAEIDKIRHGAHGARSPQQAIAIGLSEARRAGVKLKPPAKGKAKAKTMAHHMFAVLADVLTDWTRSRVHMVIRSNIRFNWLRR